MAKKRTPDKTARKLAATSTKERGKKPAKRPLAKPAKSLAKGRTIRAVTIRKPSTMPAKGSLPKPANSPAKDTIATTNKPAAEPAKTTTVKTAATTSRLSTEEAAKAEHTWVVWQDGRGIWVGTLQDFKDAKRPETIVCDVIDRGTLHGSAALHRAIQLGETLRQNYANHMKSWLQYDDAAQKQRIQDWYEGLGDR